MTSTITASVELTDESYIDTVWMLAWERTDWLAIVYRDTPTSTWTMWSRFRFYSDSADRDAFDGKDKKSGYRVTANDGPRLVAITDEAAKKLQQHTQGRLWTLAVKGDADKYLRLLKEQPWAHMKTVTACE